MAVRRPLVLIGGRVQELPSGDALPAANIPEVTAANIHAAPSKTAPADADELGITDSAASWALKKLTFANLKTWLSGLFVGKTGDTMTGNLMVEGVGHADVAVRSYGYGGDGATIHGYQALGTKAAPTAPTAGDPLFGIGARPYTGAGWAAHSVGAIHIFARQNITTAQQGTSFRIATTPLGGTWNDRIHAVAFECDGVGQGARWRARFSGATQAERSFIQDNSGNATALGVVSGATSGSSAAVNCFSRSDPDNSPYLQLGANETIGVSRVYSGALGSASAMPLSIGTDTSQLILSATSPLGTFSCTFGYGVGAGGSVTQATSKTTAVTLNKPSGRITMSSGALASGATAQFVINNSLVTNADLAVVGLNGDAVNAVKYEAICVGTIAGGIVVNLRNTSAGSLSDAVQINFAVIKAAQS